MNPSRGVLSWLAFVTLLVWVVRCLRQLASLAKPCVGRVVAGLLAGIVLVDCAALPQLTMGITATFLGLFLLALLMQRTIPAT